MFKQEFQILLKAGFTANGSRTVCRFVYTFCHDEQNFNKKQEKCGCFNEKFLS